MPQADIEAAPAGTAPNKKCIRRREHYVDEKNREIVVMADISGEREDLYFGVALLALKDPAGNLIDQVKLQFPIPAPTPRGAFANYDAAAEEARQDFLRAQRRQQRQIQIAQAVPAVR